MSNVNGVWTPNAQQASVVAHERGPLIVLAGAGSGKTATIVARVAQRIAAGMSPEQILMLTFSNKAASEMRERLHLAVPDSEAVKAVTVSTFHAFGYRLVQEFPEACERSGRVTLLDESDQLRLLRRLARDRFGEGMALEGLPWRTWLEVYGLAKNEGWRAVNTEHASSLLGFLEKRLQRLLRRDEQDQFWTLFHAYEASKQDQNVVDYDDLLLLPTLALRRHADLADTVAGRYSDVTVDESQDTNRLQYWLLRRLTLGHRNVVMVGDDDQTLYGWRGARMDNLHTFIKEYEARVVRMERNYRSSPAIVAAAAQHVAHNVDRLDKTPYAEGEPGDPPVGRAYADGRDMARAVVSALQADIAAGRSPLTLAVLYRNNFMADVLEPVLREAGIPYQVVGGVSFFARPEIKALLAAVRLQVNARDESAFMALLPFLEGLGETGAKRLVDAARAANMPIPLMSEVLTGKGRASLERLVTGLEDMWTGGPRALAGWALSPDGLNLPGYFARQKDSPAKIESRIARVQGFADWACQAFQGLSGTQLWVQLCEQALGGDIEQASVFDERVTLSTIHRAKGLEWDHVHVVGVSEGLMPAVWRGDEADVIGKAAHIEEERRVSYVALTRARLQCTLHHADAIFMHGQVKTFQPSRFLREIGVAAPAPAPAARRQSVFRRAG